MSAGSTRSGLSPICQSSSSRRGEAEASTSTDTIATASSPQMQHANQREEAPCRVVVDRSLVGEPLHQQGRPLIVQRSPSDVDRLDLRQARRANRLVIALADHEVVADDTAKRGERQDHSLSRSVRRRSNLDAQSVLFDRQAEMKRAIEPGGGRKTVLLEQI